MFSPDRRWLAAVGPVALLFVVWTTSLRGRSAPLPRHTAVPLHGAPSNCALTERGDGYCPSALDVTRTILGEPQRNWLIDGLGHFTWRYFVASLTFFSASLPASWILSPAFCIALSTFSPAFSAVPFCSQPASRLRANPSATANCR